MLVSVLFLHTTLSLQCKFPAYSHVCYSLFSAFHIHQKESFISIKISLHFLHLLNINCSFPSIHSFIYINITFFSYLHCLCILFPYIFFPLLHFPLHYFTKHSFSYPINTTTHTFMFTLHNIIHSVPKLHIYIYLFPIWGDYSIYQYFFLI